MKIKSKVYLVRLVKEPDGSKQLLVLEEMGFDETLTEEVPDDKDLALLANQLAYDNKVNEKMMLGIKKVGDEFKFREKIVTE